MTISKYPDFPTDFFLEVSRGNIPGITHVNKFGRTTDADSGVATDVWDGANATDATPIWVAPTTARIHDIVSTSANDDGDPVGTGAQTVRVYGLTSWSSDEVSEDITMNGVTNVATSNSYVIIHRMKVLTWGTAGPNVGKITATAQTDATVTAYILIDQGQTQMAIYGIPSTKTGYMTSFYAEQNKASGVSTANVNAQLLINEYADNQLVGFVVKHTRPSGELPAHSFNPYKSITGPAIVKIQATSDTNNTDVDAGFDIILIDN